MSQKTLAGLAGLSQRYISQIESGVKPLDRRSTQVAIAQALNISVTQMLGQPATVADPVRDRAVAHVPAIRDALIELAHGERRSPRRDVDETRAAVRQVTDLRNGADYAALAPQLPALLLDLSGHNGAAAPEMVETLFAARYALRTMGYPDLAREAAQIGVRVAREHDQPAWTGQAIYNLVQSFPAESAGVGQRLVERAADELQGASCAGATEVYGCLHVLAGYASAVALDAAAAWAHLDEAADVARALGEPARSSELSAGWNGNWFGPAQVEVWRVAVAAELGDAATATEVATRLDLSALPVRDLVTTLVTRAKRRAVADELASLARTLGLDPL